MNTIANVKSEQGSHWYFPNGDPCYEVENKAKGGMRPTTIADARKLNLLPSVTSILKVLDKPALTAWKIEQACLAVLTTPRPVEEPIDAFVQRVLHTERVQDQESQIARDRGTEIHDAMEKAANGEVIPVAILPWIEPAWDAVSEYGKTYETESILVGDGYAGRTDLIQDSIDATGTVIVWDFKSAKKLPKSEPWPDHQLQLSAYAMALCRKIPTSKIITKNCYISTVDCGEFVILDVPFWSKTYNEGFLPLVKHWRWANSYPL